MIIIERLAKVIYESVRRKQYGLWEELYPERRKRYRRMARAASNEIARQMKEGMVK